MQCIPNYFGKAGFVGLLLVDGNQAEVKEEKEDSFPPFFGFEIRRNNGKCSEIKFPGDCGPAS